MSLVALTQTVCPKLGNMLQNWVMWITFNVTYCFMVRVEFQIMILLPNEIDPEECTFECFMQLTADGNG